MTEPLVSSQSALDLSGPVEIAPNIWWDNIRWIVCHRSDTDIRPAAARRP